MAHLVTYTRDELYSLVRFRDGETKLGEKVQPLSAIDDITATSAKFILLGICEDIGVRANLGVGGTQTMWPAALSSILNIQNNTRIPASEIAVLGFLDFEEELRRAGTLDRANRRDLELLRSLVSEIDLAVLPVLQAIFSAGKIPIVVGGGHNNSYPIIRAFAEVKKEPVNVINLDAHADFRRQEGRHSGNGFSYAFHQGYLKKYAVLGLHENYNSESMLAEMALYGDSIQATFFEDLLRENTSYDKAFAEALNFTNGLCGLEIDIDCIAGVLSSALSPTGFSVTQIRELIYQTRPFKMQYLHVTEGAVKLENGKHDELAGKLVTYFISDFIKAQS